VAGPDIDLGDNLMGNLTLDTVRIGVNHTFN